MPYGSYATPEMAVNNAVRMMKESGADALKLQLGKEGSHIIKAVADAGVPVMSHVGLLPHKVHLMGGFKMQGGTADAAMKIIEDAKAIERAGAIGLEIEAMPIEVGRAVDQAVSIFTFSIGAGAAGTCQLLNGYDLLGAFDPSSRNLQNAMPILPKLPHRPFQNMPKMCVQAVFQMTNIVII